MCQVSGTLGVKGNGLEHMNAQDHVFHLPEVTIFLKDTVKFKQVLKIKVGTSKTCPAWS